MNKGYINVPYNVLKRKGLSDKSKLIYGLIGGFFSGEFRASNDWIAKTLGCSSRSVQRAVKELREKKLIYCTLMFKDNIIVGRQITLTKDYHG